MPIDGTYLLPGASEYQVLLLLYLAIASVVFAVLSVIIWLWLILHRSRALRREEDERRQREELADRLAGLLFSAEPAAPNAPGLVLPRIDLGFVETIQRIREALDPGGRERLRDILGRTPLRRLSLRRVYRGSVEKQVIACQVLPLFDDPEVVHALRETLKNHGAEVVRIAAARALIELDAAPPLRVMLAQLTADNHDPPMIVKDVLFRAAGRSPEQIFQAVCDESVQPVLKVFMVEALGRIAPPGADVFLRTFFHHPEPGLRGPAWEAYARLPLNPGLDVIDAALKDPLPRVRAVGVGLLARRRDYAPGTRITRLKRALRDKDWWVTYQAIQALVRVGERGVDALAEALLSLSDETSVDMALAAVLENRRTTPAISV